MRWTWTLLCLFAAMAAACGEDTPTDATTTRARPLIVTSCEPLAYVARRLAGDSIDVECVVPPDKDSAHWRPTKEGLLRLQDADLVLVNGAGYELWLGAVSLGRRRVVDTTADLKEPFIEDGKAVRHAHGDGEMHEHGTRNGHTWLDPKTLQQQARAAADALRRLPPLANRIDTTGIDADLDALDEAFRSLGTLPEGEALVATQTSYAYLARRYGWDVVHVPFEPDYAANDTEIAQIAKKLDGRRARFVLWTAAPNAENVAQFEKAGYTNLVLPLGAVTAPGTTYLDVVKQNVETLRPAFAPQ